MTRKKTERPAFGEDDSYTVQLRKRLWKRYERLGGWGPLAAALGVNVGIVYRFVVEGTIPRDAKLRRALGVRSQRRRGPKKTLWYWENLLRWEK